MRNLLLAGIPRSGTTLACSRLNRLPDVAALPEPMDVSQFAKTTTPVGWARILDSYFSKTRSIILKQGCATAKVGIADSEDNYFLPSSGSSLRQDVGAQRALTFRHIKSSRFTLIVKHPNAFSAMLQGLQGIYPIFAMIRNPLAVLASWNSIDAAFRTGHAPIAEAICGPLQVRLAHIANTPTRQLALLSWYFEQYQQFLPAERVIRYESMIASGGAALAALVPAAAALNEPLRNKNRNPAYAELDLRGLADRLLDSDGAYWSYYSRDDVLSLLNCL